MIHERLLLPGWKAGKHLAHQTRADNLGCLVWSSWRPFQWFAHLVRTCNLCLLQSRVVDLLKTSMLSHRYVVYACAGLSISITMTSRGES